MADFSKTVEAQLSGGLIRVTPLAEFNFASGVTRLHSGTGDLELDGQTWRGIGNWGAISEIESGPRGAVEEIELTLFGSAAMLATLSDDAAESEGRAVNIYMQFFDVRREDHAGQWVDWQPLDRFQAFWGVMGPLSVRRESGEGDGRGSRVISVRAHNALINRRRPPHSYFSDVDQAARGSPDDQIFRRIHTFVNGVVRWPKFGSGST